MRKGIWYYDEEQKPAPSLYMPNVFAPDASKPRDLRTPAYPMPPFVPPTQQLQPATYSGKIVPSLVNYLSSETR